MLNKQVRNGLNETWKNKICYIKLKGWWKVVCLMDGVEQLLDPKTFFFEKNAIFGFVAQ